MQNKLKPSLLLLALVVITSCQDILECVINRHPQLPDQRLEVGQVDRYYYDEILADIKNEPRDNSYYYYFSVSGDLPPGMDYRIEYRTIVLEGTPIKSGNYRMNVHLSVEQANDYHEECENNLNDCDGLCTETTVRTYNIIIR